MPETIAFIPARGGSKSIPLKNIKLFCGKPLIYWTMRAAQLSEEIDRLVVSTDSQEIKEVALSLGFDKTEIHDRSSENASDTASTESVMLEYLREQEIDIKSTFVLIQTTSPFTQWDHLSEALNKFYRNELDSLLSACTNKRFFWTADGKPINYDPKSRPRRQDFDGCLMENGAFYISKVSNILESQNRLSGRIGIYKMPEYTGLELDEPADWVIGEVLMQEIVLKA